MGLAYHGCGIDKVYLVVDVGLQIRCYVGADGKAQPDHENGQITNMVQTAALYGRGIYHYASPIIIIKGCSEPRTAHWATGKGASCKTVPSKTGNHPVPGHPVTPPGAAI